MPWSTERHRVFIVQENGRDSIDVTPDYLPISRGDEIMFQVVGEKGAFHVRPETEVFERVRAGGEIAVERGISPVHRVSREVPIGSVHRYEIVPREGESYDPVLIIYR